MWIHRKWSGHEDCNTWTCCTTAEAATAKARHVQRAGSNQNSKRVLRDIYLFSASPHGYTRAGLLCWLCKYPVQWRRWPVWLDEHESVLMVRSTWRLVWAQAEEADRLNQRTFWSQLLGLQQDQTSGWACMERSFIAKNSYCWASIWYWKHHCRPWWGGKRHHMELCGQIWLQKLRTQDFCILMVTMASASPRAGDQMGIHAMTTTQWLGLHSFLQQ